MAVTIGNLRITPPTAPGGYGTIMVDIASTTGAYSLSITQSGTAISAISGSTPAIDVTVLTTTGTVLLTVSDLQSGSTPYQQVLSVPDYAPPPVLGCTDPAADNYDPTATQDDGSCTYPVVPVTPFFNVPGLQSLRFYFPTQAARPVRDTQPFKLEQPLNINNPGYCQKVQQSDTLVIQYQTNYQGAHTVQLVPIDSASATPTFAPERKVIGVGNTATFDAYATADGAMTNRTRIYFNSDILPAPFVAGNRVTLAGPGLNGTYPVFSVLEDAAAGVPYLLLQVAYPGTMQRVDLTLTTTYTVQVFDTWQVVVPFASVPAECYQLVISVSDPEFGTDYAESEPIDVAAAHRDTVLVAWRNFDNAFALNYTAGLINRVRVVGQFSRFENPTQKEVLRESSGRLVLLNGEIQRRILLRTFLLPDYVHERLASAFCHDFVRVNGVEVVPELEYLLGEPQEGYSLRNGSIALEQQDFLGKGNRDDIGDLEEDGGPFLVVNEQFLRISQ